MQTDSINPLEGIVSTLSSHSHLHEPDRTALLGLSNLQDCVRREEEARSPHGVVSDACLVVSGLIGSVAFTKEGKRQIIAVFIPGEVCNVGAIIAEESSTMLMALAASEVRWIRGTEIVRVTHGNLAITKAFWRQSVLHAAVLKEWVINLGRRFARERLAHLLCEMACRYAPGVKKDRLEFVFPVTQEQIADIVGLTGVRVSQALNSLRAANIVDVRRGRVRILDWDRLTHTGDFSPHYLPAEERAWARPIQIGPQRS